MLIHAIQFLLSEQVLFHAIYFYCHYSCEEQNYQGFDTGWGEGMNFE